MTPMTSLVPLGDQAALAYCVDEAAAGRFAAAVRRAAAPWLVDVVQAYHSVAVFYNLDQTTFESVAQRLRAIEGEVPAAGVERLARLHRVPCCYELQLDLERVVDHTGLAAEEVIRLHTETSY